MSYGYSAKTKAFYVMEEKEAYAANGNWPDDVNAIDDTVWETYSQAAPVGQVRGTNKKGFPCWEAEPPVSHEQAAEMAAYRRRMALEAAASAIAPLQDAIDLDIASDAERDALQAWKKYRVEINRVDPNNAPDIDWPEAPAV